MFQSFIYLSKRLFNFWVNTYFTSHSFFCRHYSSILDVSQFVKMLWFCELVLRNFDCSLEFVFSLLLLQPFNFSPVSFACNFQDWGCIILREIDFLLKICWSIPCLYPSWKVHNSSDMSDNLTKQSASLLGSTRFGRGPTVGKIYVMRIIHPVKHPHRHSWWSGFQEETMNIARKGWLLFISSKMKQCRENKFHCVSNTRSKSMNTTLHWSFRSFCFLKSRVQPRLTKAVK